MDNPRVGYNQRKYFRNGYTNGMGYGTKIYQANLYRTNGYNNQRMNMKLDGDKRHDGNGKNERNRELRDYLDCKRNNERSEKHQTKRARKDNEEDRSGRASLQ